MKKLLIIALLVLAACNRNNDNEEPVVTMPTPSLETPTPAPTVLPTSTPAPTATPTATPTPVATVAPTPTPEIPRAVCTGQGPVKHVAMGWNVIELRMQPCETAAIPVIVPLDNHSSVSFTQGQQPATPANSTTEFYVSKTPGLIQNDGSPCYQKTVFDNYNNILIYTKPLPSRGWVDQASLGQNGCWAPASEGTWYVNVRWAYHVCQYGACGFSMQWAPGAW